MYAPVTTQRRVSTPSSSATIARARVGRAMSARTAGMYRGYVTHEGEIYVATGKEEAKRIQPAGP